MALQPLHLLRFGRAFARQKLRHRAPESRIGDEMRRPGRDRAIAARQLVPALRARLDAGQTARDRDVDGAIITQLEMQIGDVGNAAPIAAVKRVSAPPRSEEPTSELKSLMRNMHT